MFYMNSGPCTESLSKHRGTEGMEILNMEDYI